MGYGVVKLFLHDCNSSSNYLSYKADMWAFYVNKKEHSATLVLKDKKLFNLYKKEENNEK